MKAYLAHVSESTIEARGCRPPDPITANHQSNSFSVPPLPQNCPCPLVCTTSNGDTTELDYEMLCLADPGRGSKGAANVACPMAWAELCAEKECKDRKWGPAFAEGIAEAGPQIWIDGRPLRGPSLFRTDTQGREPQRRRARPVAIAAAAGNRRGRGRRAAAAMPCSCSGMDMEWTLMNNCRDARPNATAPLRRK